MTTRMVDRYAAMFERLAARREGAFVPFLVLGDPDPQASAGLLDALVEGGADAVELGIPFSDPIADGPVIQEADLRALAAGVRPADALELVAGFRERHPDVPVGLLVYANLVEQGGPASFYRRCAAAGVDSVLVADVPAFEARPFAEAAVAAGVDPVLIAPPNATPEALDLVAELSRGYTYCVARRGVTGTRERLAPDAAPLFAELERRGAPPGLLGFGVSAPDHVRAALAAGAAGAISGSAVVERAARHEGRPELAARAVREFVAEMKAASRR
jgi:tryptophan synthase alpha chain